MEGLIDLSPRGFIMSSASKALLLGSVLLGIPSFHLESAQDGARSQGHPEEPGAPVPRWPAAPTRTGTIRFPFQPAGDSAAVAAVMP